ncbi:hypothetical protein SLA2020_439100 [Shorea laevis]
MVTPNAKTKGPQESTAGSNTVNLNQKFFSSFIIDNSFYGQVLEHRGVLQIDQELALDPLTSDEVSMIAHGDDFGSKFGEAMVKLGAIGVLTGTDGEIRKSCRAINNPTF